MYRNMNGEREKEHSQYKITFLRGEGRGGMRRSISFSRESQLRAQLTLRRPDGSRPPPNGRVRKYLSDVRLH